MHLLYKYIFFYVMGCDVCVDGWMYIMIVWMYIYFQYMYRQVWKNFLKIHWIKFHIWFAHMSSFSEHFVHWHCLMQHEQHSQPVMVLSFVKSKVNKSWSFKHMDLFLQLLIIISWIPGKLRTMSRLL